MGVILNMGGGKIYVKHENEGDVQCIYFVIVATKDLFLRYRSISDKLYFKSKPLY